MKKFFPIQTKTACRLKWSWSTVYLTTGDTASCHRASYAKLNENNFFDFHNLPNKREDREKMLKGEWPGNGCEYCRDIELQGGVSDRQFQLSVPDEYADELNYNATATKVSPAILEIFFKNTCNLKCVYCSEKYSSEIQKENAKFGYMNIQNERSVLMENQYDNLSKMFWQWLENNFIGLQRVHILGGEPFLQDDFNRLLDFIETHPNNKLQLVIISNLSIKEKILQNTIKKIYKLIANKKIKSFEINASIDGWGPGQEYIRNGLDLKLFESNINFLLQYKFIRICLLTTVTNLSIFEMPDLFNKFKEWNKIRKIYWYMHNVLPHGDSIFSPAILPYDIFKNTLEEVYEKFDDNDYDEKNTKNLLFGIIQYCSNGQIDSNKQKELIRTLNQIDNRRNLNWQNHFSWLKDVVQ